MSRLIVVIGFGVLADLSNKSHFDGGVVVYGIASVGALLLIIGAKKIFQSPSTE